MNCYTSDDDDELYIMFHTWNNFKQNNADPGYYELEAKDGDSVHGQLQLRAALGAHEDEHQHRGTSFNDGYAPVRAPDVTVPQGHSHMSSRANPATTGGDKPQPRPPHGGAPSGYTIGSRKAGTLGRGIRHTQTQSVASRLQFGAVPAAWEVVSETALQIEVELADHGAAEGAAESLEVAALDVVLDALRTARHAPTEPDARMRQ